MNNELSPEIINALSALAGAIISGVVAFVIYFKNRVKKTLSVRLSRPTKLIDIHESFKSAVEIKVRGIPSNNASSIDYWITNSGNTPIEDINLGIKVFGNAIIFGGNAPQTNIAGVTSEDIIFKIADDSKVQIITSCLNPGDQIRGHIRMANIPDDVKVQFRSPGVRLKLLAPYDAMNRLNLVLYDFAERYFFLSIYLSLFSPEYRRIKKENKKIVPRNKSE